MSENKATSPKMRLLALLKLFWEETDEEHTLTVPEMIERLHKMGIAAERRAIYDDIAVLTEFGLDIVHTKSKTHDYFLGSREFELPELKLLVDAVQSSRFITHKKSVKLIKKLETLTSRPQSGKLERQVFIENRAKTPNESIYYNIDSISDAIQKGKAITFLYSEYSANKQLVLRRDGERYTAAPYLLIWNNDNYYMVAYYERYGGLCHFRVDKMSRISITDIPVAAPAGNIDPAEYAKRNFSMFAGEESEIELEFSKDILGAIIDRFGTGIVLSEAKDGFYRTRLNVALSPAFYSWIFQFGEKACITAPAKASEDMAALLRSTLALYEK